MVGDRVRFASGGESLVGEVVSVRDSHVVVRVLRVVSGRLRSFRFLVQRGNAQRELAS
jgi:hypothetical protein